MNYLQRMNSEGAIIQKKVYQCIFLSINDGNSTKTNFPAEYSKTSSCGP